MFGSNNVRPGDWVCSGCGISNFASRRQCRSCDNVRGSQAIKEPYDGSQANYHRRHRSRTPAPRSRTSRTDEAHSSGVQGQRFTRNANGNQTFKEPYNGSQAYYERKQRSRTPVSKNRISRTDGAHSTGIQDQKHTRNAIGKGQGPQQRSQSLQHQNFGNNRNVGQRKKQDGQAMREPNDVRQTNFQGKQRSRTLVLNSKTPRANEAHSSGVQGQRFARNASGKGHGPQQRSQSLQNQNCGNNRNVGQRKKEDGQAMREPNDVHQTNFQGKKLSRMLVSNSRTPRANEAHSSGVQDQRFARNASGKGHGSQQRLQSLQNISCANNRNKILSNYSRILDQRRKREYPIEYKELEKMLEQYPDQIVMQLQMESSGYDLLLDEPDVINIDKMFLVMQVLGRAVETRSNRGSLNILFTKTFKPKFINHLIKSSLTIATQEGECSKLCIYFQNLWLVLDKCAQAMPSLAMNQLFLVIESCLMCLKQRSEAELSELIEMYESTKSNLEKENKKWQSQGQDGSRSNQRRRWEDNLQPPENFREIPIIPTIQELSDPDKPFLRRNIVRGQYDDVEHYLDIQFRLLREDFIRPLRNGIQEFKENVNSHNGDLYIYKDVRIMGAVVKNFKVIHMVELNLPKTFKAENSKRLMYGNLICCSCDNFKTVLFGSVSEKNDEKLKEGLIGVEFDSDIKSTQDQTYIMAETKSFFTAYKHVLKALQRITKDTFPMEEFIVHVDSDMPLPDYLDREAQYDLQVMRNRHMMKDSEVHSDLFPQKRRPIKGYHQEWPTLQKVPIARDLDFWPTCDDIGIDDSQCRALKSALTSKLSIIQGPPGTGKTFIGLKIAQVLLHNSQYWKNEEHKSPILVVCFTNHALDQFLEGMTPFTNNIVRVGSRSKSKIIQEFQINNSVRSLKCRKEMPQEVHHMNTEMMEALANVESKVKSTLETLCQLRKPIGIFKIDFLLKHNVIPENIAFYFQTHRMDLLTYLMDPRFINIVKGKMLTNLSLNTKGKINIANDATNSIDEVLQDAGELVSKEEQGRKLDESFVNVLGSNLVPTDNLNYDILLGEVDEEIQKLYASMDAINHEIKALQRKRIKTDKLQNMQQWYGRKLDELQNKHALLNCGVNTPFDADVAETCERNDITILDFEKRWMLYKLWLYRVEEKVLPKLMRVKAEMKEAVAVYNEVKDQQYLHVMRRASVVGMTTTGVAEYSNILHALQPSIVIIEEAAEILEAHVITSLTQECQHLIMIGDHQQLQPSPTVYELAKKFGLETSLFERLVKNKIAFETLEYQHRMRPNISKLLVPSIYPRLKDHESVHLYPHIKGMNKDVFFITHKHHENKAGDDNSSKENAHEAELIMALCRHLLLQDYSADDITVLTPYSGQFFLLKKIQRRYEECEGECKGVRISVVDNFQGEESNIILLSLVRSNEEGKVGFLRTENRICVALSRAKLGLYITGNMSQLQESSDLWKKIQADLISDEAIGSSVVLQCGNHPEILSSVTTGEDVITKSPDGGCRKPCLSVLPKCGHKCPKCCHIKDPEHEIVKCPIPCPRVICKHNHPCPQKCGEECDPCIVPMPKTLPCGHIHEFYCCDYDRNFDCPTIVERVLPDCQHKVEMECFNDVDTFPCPTPCKIRLLCGHSCTMECHVKDDPDHLEYQCEQPCPRSPKNCSQQHKCEKTCYEDCGLCTVPVKKKAACSHTHEVGCSTPKENIICNKKCKRMLPCGHHCPQMCKDPCGGCKVKVSKIIADCHHKIKVECSKDGLKSNCFRQCILELQCGHRCKARCKDPCTARCNVLVASNIRCPKGHLIKMPCYLQNTVTKEEAWSYCSEPCDAILDCKHYCKGKCALCLHGRLHIACSEKCERSLVCGHICKAECSSACPPCQEKCPEICKHRRCKKKCGELCNPCQQKCKRTCSHFKCGNRCGDKFSQKPCEKPCPKKLKCGHPCVGYCGDPCPPLCRICNREKLTEILFGSENKDDARFVWLEDCGHVIEADGLRGWLSQTKEEIGMKCCPRCKKPIYVNHRNRDLVLMTYENVRGVKNQYYSKRSKQQEQESKKLLKDMETLPGAEMEQIKRSLPPISLNYVLKIRTVISNSEISLYNFQVQVLKEIGSLVNDNEDCITALTPYIDFVKKRVMDQKLRIAPQLVEEITSELQRLHILPPYWKLLKKVDVYENTELLKIRNKLAQLMDPTIKFDSELEKKVKQQLKESEKYIGGLGITDHERVEILQAMGLKQGHWYKCPNGHIYCITECGGAMVEAKCPECGARIGGGSHVLRSDNAVATKMDGT